jgi:hypothetical protein
MDVREVLFQFQDHLAPKLDTYEQALFLYILRHTRLMGLDEAVIGFKSARRKMALGIGEKGKPMSEHVCYEKLRSLQDKGCIQILGTERSGTRLRPKLPDEIPGIVPSPVILRQVSLEDMDFFNVPENRALILRREDNNCFYCLRAIGSNNYVIEHVVSRPEGTNGYRNVVAACRQCNNRKGSSSAEDFFRTLYREGLLDASESEGRMSQLRRLVAGELRPVLHGQELP